MCEGWGERERPSKFENFMGNLGDTLEDVGDAIKDGSQDIVGDAKDEIKDVIDEIKDHANEEGAKKKDSFVDQVKDEIEDGLEDIKERTKDHLEDMANNSTDAFRDFDTDFGDEAVFNLAQKGTQARTSGDATPESHVVGYAAASVCAFGLALVVANKQCNKSDVDFQRV